MTETICGLDIGVNAVKALLVISRGRMDTRILAFETVRLEDGVDLDAALKIIAATLKPLAPSRIRCVVSLPSADAMFRQIHLPFHDDNKIRKTLTFELEPLLPLPVEEVVADYIHLPEGGLLAAAIGKERIREVLAAVETHLGQVSAIDIGAAALVLPLLEQKALTGAGILLDIGAAATVASFYEKNALVQIRSFAFGGDTITRALAEDSGCDPAGAEQIKISAAYGTSIEKALAACRNFCGELANTVEFMRLNETLHDQPARIVITGGGSLFQPLGDELGKTMGLPVEALGSGGFGHLEIDEKMKSRCLPPLVNTALATTKRAASS
ncbi:MAG TPA: pilus assembly protein PilM, partial [Smithellaceae bacterium]|nr:pilus assembly protein PilM [Smithellaceae bacterium]